MQKSRFTDSQILAILKQADVMTTTIAMLCTKNIREGEEPPAW